MFKSAGQALSTVDKPSKYKAEKVTVLGIEFDSKKEARRWFELRLLEQAGEISNLRRQVSFELIPAQREPDTVGKRGGIIRGKTLEKAVSYRADFVYQDKDGNAVIEDAKGYKGGSAYAVFSIKRKLILWRYGIRIKEV